MTSSMIRRAAGATALAALILTACYTESEVKPGERITIAGTVADQNGNPVPGARVAFSRAGDVEDTFALLASLGFVCTPPEPPRACQAEKVTTADEDGAYRFDLRGRDTQGIGRSARTLYLTAGFDPAGTEVTGPRTILRFIAQTKDLNLPLRAWQPRLRIDPGPTELAVRTDAFPKDLAPAGVQPARTSLVFEDRAGALVWRQTMRGEGSGVDPRLLEDVDGVVAVVAQQDNAPVSPGRGTNLGYTIRSGGHRVRGTAGAPVSRGTACALRANPKAESFVSSCSLTDGVFGQPDPSPSADAAVIDLGSPRPIHLVVLRSCAGTCHLQHSMNARTWTRLGNGADQVITIEPGAVPRARYIRVRSGLVLPTELSVWDVPVAPFEPQQISPFEPADTGTQSDPESDENLTWILIGIAIMLAAAAAGLFFWRWRANAGRASSA
jgi:hypothetical protein